MKKLISLGVCLLAAGALFADAPTISDVTLSVGGRIVTVDYKLANGPAIVTAEFATNGVVVDCGWPFSMPGDVARVVTNETCRFCWTVDLSWPEADIVANGLSVTLKAWALDTPPDYLVVDFSTFSNRLYFASEQSLPGGIGNPVYRSSAVVMRHIPVSSDEWRMGCVSTYPYQGNASWETNHYVKMTKDYYIGVFPLTQGLYRYFGGKPQVGGSGDAQAHSVENGYPDGDLKPLTIVTFVTVRGSYNWPTDGHKVEASSLLGMLRTRSGVEFDFPTEVQWEYACRAGTETCNYAGSKSSDVNAVAWTSENWRDDPACTSNQTHAVGQKRPNGFGLYDMLGNTYEFALDYFTYDLTSPEFYLDSVGPTNALDSTKERVTRSGHWNQGASNSNAHYRRKCPQTSGSVNNGFRLACPCPIETL